MIIEIRLSAAQVQTCHENAILCSLGGRSHIRKGDDRQERLCQDQLVGQLGELACCLAWFGSDEHYLKAREIANANPTKGDGGSDIPNTNIDAKTSLMRTHKDPLKYNLLVRPRERHANWIYVLVLLKTLEGIKEDGATLYVVGWMDDGSLPAKTAGGGPFRGAHVVPASKLNPFPKINWRVNESSRPRRKNVRPEAEQSPAQQSV